MHTKQGMWPDQLRSTLSEQRLIAVLVFDSAEDAVPTARALVKGGVRIMELALRTPAAFDALRAIRAEVPAKPRRFSSVASAG